MQQKVIRIEDREITVKELLAVQADEINWDDRKEAIKKQILFCTDLTEKEYSSLTLKERLTIIKVMNELNGLEDFQNPVK